jgi:hypothetical protein
VQRETCKLSPCLASLHLCILHLASCCLLDENRHVSAGEACLTYDHIVRPSGIQHEIACLSPHLSCNTPSSLARHSHELNSQPHVTETQGKTHEGVQASCKGANLLLKPVSYAYTDAHVIPTRFIGIVVPLDSWHQN